jgi:MFS family permease
MGDTHLTVGKHIGIWRILAWAICALGAIFYLYEYLLRISPNVMVPELMLTFQLSSADGIAALSGWYFYAYTPMQLPVGVLLDKYGPRRILTLATFSCAIGAVIFATTTSYYIAAAARFFIGFGSAFAFVGVLKLASIWLPPNRFAFVAGFTTALAMLGGMFGTWAMDRMVSVVGWEPTLKYFGWLGFFLAPLMWFLVRDVAPSYTSDKINKLVEKANMSFSQLGREFLDLTKNRQIWINGCIGGLLMLPTMVFAELWGVEYLRAVHGMESKLAAQLSTMVFLGWAIGGPIAGTISDKLGNRRLPLLVGTLMAALIMCLFLYVPNLSTPVIIVLFIAFGIASSVENICFAVGKESAPANISGTAIAFTNFIVVGIGASAQRLVSKLLDLTSEGPLLTNGLAMFSPEAFKTAMLIMPAGLFLAVLLIACCLKESGGSSGGLGSR